MQVQHTVASDDVPSQSPVAKETSQSRETLAETVDKISLLSTSDTSSVISGDARPTPVTVSAPSVEAGTDCGTPSEQDDTQSCTVLDPEAMKFLFGEEPRTPISIR